MAIWQNNFMIIPKAVYSKECFNLESYIDRDGIFDDESFWLSEPTEVSFFNKIEQILPKGKSWSNDIALFGEQESNRFEIYKNEDNITISVSFRIDYTIEYEDVLREIIRFCEMNNLAILSEKLELLDNNFITIKSYIENSNQRVVYENLLDKKD